MCFLCECYKTSDVTLVSEDDNDNSDVIVLKKLEKFSISRTLVLGRGVTPGNVAEGLRLSRVEGLHLVMLIGGPVLSFNV